MAALTYHLPPELVSEYSQQAARSSVGALRFICFLALILYPLFGLVDWLRFPEVVTQLITVRAAVLPIIGAVLVATFRPAAPRYASLLGILFFHGLALGITLMVVMTGGARSSYYAGLLLVIFAQVVAMRWTGWQSTASLVIIWFTYLAAVLILDRDYASYDWRRFAEHNFFMAGMVLIGSLSSFVAASVYRSSFHQTKRTEAEAASVDALLHSILPRTIIEELRTTGRVEPRTITTASVIFTDFVGFSQIVEKLPPDDVVMELDRAFEFIELTCLKYGLEKIKTIGDSFMCAAGVPEPISHHAVRAVLTSLEVRSFLNMMNQIRTAVGEHAWEIRIGIHSGPVAGGVIGTTKFGYDVWGDTVNLASRMESSGAPQRVNMSQETYDLVHGFFLTEDRGRVETKGRAPQRMYFAERLRPEWSGDEDGRTPSAALLRLLGKSA